MALQRKDFTMLAEFLGQLAAGRIPLTEVVEEMASTLEEHCGPESLFKRDKFTRHAEEQRKIEGVEAQMIEEGQSFTVDGLLLRCDGYSRIESTGEIVLWVRPDSADDTTDLGTSHDAQLSFVFDPETIV